MVEATAETIPTKQYLLVRSSTVDYPESLTIGSLIINVKGKESNLLNYFGEDFSGYYYSWKTGKIGLSSLDGAGAFQGYINEVELQHMGYEKKGL